METTTPTRTGEEDLAQGRAPKRPRPEHLVEEGAAFAELEGLEGPAPGDAGRRAPARSSAGGFRESFDVVVIGAGQAGLSVGYYLARRGLRFIILDAGERIGDAWRDRWDSLRLFTPARYDGLPGMPFPAPPDTFPTKEEMGDYLESYAAHFELPVRTKSRVERLSREDGRYVVGAGGQELEAEHVVVAMANYQRPKVPAFSRELRRDILQIHSGEYRNPSQLQSGGVLIVGAGNSGAEIAMELAPDRRVWISGRDVGQLPFRIGGLPGRLFLVRLVLRFVFHRVLTVRTWLGRKAHPTIVSQGGPLIRIKSKDLAAAGVERVARTAGTRDGLPRLEDGRLLDIANVVWCTGFDPGFTWIDLPILGEDGKPRHDGGLVEGEPGLYFVGLHFLYSVSSAMIHGVARDAERIVDTIATRRAAAPPERRAAIA